MRERHPCVIVTKIQQMKQKCGEQQAIRGHRQSHLRVGNRRSERFEVNGYMGDRRPKIEKPGEQDHPSWGKRL